MQITYSNRKGQTYYLCRGATKTGKPRYFFSRKPRDISVEELPAGYEIQESVNGIVSLAKAKPKALLESEVAAVKAAIDAHPKEINYRIDVKAKVITVYERVGLSLQEMAQRFSDEFGQAWPFARASSRAGWEELDRTDGQFSPVMRFTLIDADSRRFAAERMCYRGEAHWINIAYDQPIDSLASELIPKLASEEYFELF